MAHFTKEDFIAGAHQNEVEFPFGKCKSHDCFVEAMALLDQTCPHRVFINVAGKAGHSFKAMISMKRWCGESTSGIWHMSGTIATENGECIKFRFETAEDATMFKLRWNDVRETI